MIINTGMRTDIPAFYGEWLINRLREGYVYVRNPYYQEQVSRYRLDPDVVDVLAFCTKNPIPFLKYINDPALDKFRQFWFVTITPYDKDIEPNVPDKDRVIEAFRRLSVKHGPDAISWRYDPILLTDKYDIEFHKKAFAEMAGKLKGATNQVVISFIDMYKKTRKNFPEARVVEREERLIIGESFMKIARENGMTVRSCCEGQELGVFGVDTSGCMTREVLEKATGLTLMKPGEKSSRTECDCMLGHDIGAYNSCGHLCKYCYANYDADTVRKNMAQHDPKSPFLIGDSEPGDKVTDAKQKSFTKAPDVLAENQLRLNI